jgi:transcriptional regulator with XRE-family HTH domain
LNFTFLLQSRNVTQAEVSAKTGLTPAELKRIEAGKSRESVTLLLSISSYFGVSLDALLRQDLSQANGGFASPSPNLAATDQLPSIDVTIDWSPEQKSDIARQKLYAWLVTKGCRVITTSKEKIQSFLDETLSHLDISTTEQFDQDSSLTVIFSLGRSISNQEPVVQKVFARLNQFHEPESKIQQTFYAPECGLLNLKEIFNLLCGRSVCKVLNPGTPISQTAWLKINFHKSLSQNQYDLEKVGSNYGFNLESVLRFYDIVECKTTEGMRNLVNSLNEGNKLLVAFETANKIVPKYIEANPVSRVLRITPFNQ